LKSRAKCVALGAGSHKQSLRQGNVAGGRRRLRAILHRQDAQAMAVPSALSMLEAGATPETLMTVWHMCSSVAR